MPDNVTYPTPESMAARWATLAREIAAARGEGACKAGPGRLVVLGSGMSHSDFTRDVEPEIQSADYVFYCLYDRVTQVWLGRLRPDAFDLTVLYSASQDRYYTYIQMAEALLHHVRRGKKVVAIYYGHPGIFATPGHRAVRIARREGHEALMRPGISALDYLVADIGFDPALPGLLSYEATDLLLRRRPLDSRLHVVLWQVGVVGDFGFRPEGFENKGYDLLVDALEQTYGPDWKVIHYNAPHYAGVEPLIDEHRIDSLRTPEVRNRLSSLSTFYIEPQDAVETDAEMSVNLGHTIPGQPVNPPERAYDIAKYDTHEEAAILSLRDFEVALPYFLPEDTPGIDFMLALSRDVSLQAQYRSDPAAALDDPRFDQLNDRARKLLAIPHPRAISAGIAEPATNP